LSALIAFNKLARFLAPSLVTSPSRLNLIESRGFEYLQSSLFILKNELNIYNLNYKIELSHTAENDIFLIFFSKIC